MSDIGNHLIGGGEPTRENVVGWLDRWVIGAMEGSTEGLKRSIEMGAARRFGMSGHSAQAYLEVLAPIEGVPERVMLYLTLANAGEVYESVAMNIHRNCGSEDY
jgi:hypothetical protein